MSPTETSLASAQHPDDALRDPPRRLFKMVRFVGPGMIVAGSIVGSGELIATTKTGAEAGFVLLWLIIVGCVVKVFAQVELGRYTVVSGKTTLSALAEVPGPRVAGRGNWLVWYWFLMWIFSISQLGGVVGGVGQALAIAVPVTEMGRDYNRAADARIAAQLQRRVRLDGGATAEQLEQASEQSRAAWQAYIDRYGTIVDGQRRVRSPADVAIWSTLLAAGTSLLLVIGRYRLIQTLSTVLVGAFTLLVIVNLYYLQDQPVWRVRASEFWSGLTFRLPESTEGLTPIRTALATFGIIGVGAAELVTYPYWCLERGYARFTGPNDGSAAWISRARGWMRVMRLDAWGSAVVYTFTTVAFYLLGAAVLHRSGLNPGKEDMVRTLAVMFVPVFSDWAAFVFLFGAVAVLYSTFFVANAAHARVFSDALRVMGFVEDSPEVRQRWVTRLSGFFPVLCLAIFLTYSEPAQLVLISGVAQGVMLPMLAGAALFFRYRRIPEPLRPGSWWDALLWISAAAMLITGLWTIFDRVAG